jgi:hypothetical protein
MTENNHPEWEHTNSLSSPCDRGDGKFRAQVGFPPLDNNQLGEAVNSLVECSSVNEKFPRVERQYADPPIHLQNIGLLSFVPSKGATPDKDGIYGFMKMRGNYATTSEAMERSEFLLRNVDSYHHIYQAHVGRPFPITLDPKYASKTEEIDIRKKAVEAISEDVRMKREQEKKDMNDIKEREKRLMEESKPDYVPDPYERYTVLRVKKAQLVWGYSQTMKQLEDMKKVIIKTREEINGMDETNPDFSKEYLDRYMKARRDAGIADEHNTEENFVKYMVEDLDLGF